MEKPSLESFQKKPPLSSFSRAGNVPNALASSNYARQNVQAPKPDSLQKATDIATSIFPGKTIGQSIGTAAGYIATKIKDIFKGTDVAKYYDVTQPKPSQIAGDVLRAGALVGGVAAAPTTLLGSAATFGGMGAAEAAGQALTQAKAPKDVAVDAFKGGLAGATIGGVGYGLGKAAQAVLQKTPEAIYNNVLKISKKIKAAGKSPATFLKDEGVWGGLGSMSKQIQQGIQDENTAITNKLAQTSGGATWGEIKAKAIGRLSSQYGHLYSPEQLNELVDSVPVAKLKEGIQNWSMINDTRRQLGSLIGDSKWLQTNPTQNTAAAQSVYRSMADLLQGVTDTKTEFSRLSKWIEANKAISGAMLDADKKFGIGLYDTFSGLLGGVTGAAFGSPTIGALAGVAGERALRSPAVTTGAAQLLSKVPQVGGAAGRAITTEAAGQMIGNQ